MFITFDLINSTSGNPLWENNSKHVKKKKTPNLYDFKATQGWVVIKSQPTYSKIILDIQQCTLSFMCIFLLNLLNKSGSLCSQFSPLTLFYFGSSREWISSAKPTMIAIPVSRYSFPASLAAEEKHQTHFWSVGSKGILEDCWEKQSLTRGKPWPTSFFLLRVLVCAVPAWGPGDHLVALRS